MWVTKLLISPVKKGFFAQKRPNLAQNWHFCPLLANIATNREIDRLDLPALSPVAKRARMEHVNESHESQVYYSLQIYHSNIPFPHLYV